MQDQITKNVPELDYYVNRRTSIGNHMGQRKLNFNEIEFLSIVFSEIDPKDTLVLYIGAANGAHQKINHELFPKMVQLFYDPAKFAIKPTEYFIIKTGNDGFFDDTKIEEVKQIQKELKRKHLVFISDIRLVVDENKIWDDMLAQQRWAIKLNAIFIKLKLRFPYTSRSDEYILFDTPLDEIRDRVVLPKKLKKGEAAKKYVLYLDGDIYTQPYAPYASTETRLICKMNKDGKYPLKYYSYKKYESQLNYWNTYIREKEITSGESKRLYHYLLGYWPNYDTLREYDIIVRYIKTMKYKNTFDTVVKLLYYINMEQIKITHRNRIFGYLETMIKQFMETDTKNEVMNPFTRKILKERMVNLKKLVNDYPNIIKKQINAIRHQHPKILSDDEIKKQEQALINYRSKWVKSIKLDPIRIVYTKMYYDTMKNIAQMINKTH